MNFASDNASGASDKVLAAIVAANAGVATPYGADPWTARACADVCRVFERDCAVYLVPTGTAANALALSSLCPPWGAVFCHEAAHIMDDECGAPEFYLGGGKLVGLPGARGKITPAALGEALHRYPRGLVKQVQPAALSITQATKSGTLYTRDEIAKLAEMARSAGLGVHMDGARFANAIVAAGCSAAEMSWRAGVDVLSFGATKNGTICCEAVIFFDPAKAADFAFRRKRGGHTLSKGRYLGAQMSAYLDADHWLDLAAHANAMAAQLASGLSGLPGVRVAWSCEANEVFATVPRKAEVALKVAGAHYYDWGDRGLEDDQPLGPDEVLLRLVASFTTEPADVKRFVSTVAAAGI